MADIKVNDIVTGIVTGIETYGIFINVDDYSGLIHISEISENFVRNVNDFAIIGDKIKAKVLEVDDENHQLKLSIKSLGTFRKKDNRAKIIETTQGFSSIESHLEGWINNKMEEINKN